ncbi:MAG: DUF4239 domain-containing protein [Methyloceanibacter sp.]
MISLIELLNEISPWLLAFIIIAAAEAFSIGLMLATRVRCGADYLSLNNEVAGFKFAVIGVLYAVLLAFVVVAVWEDYQDTEGAVRNEAKALVNLHQVSFALPEPAGNPIRQQIISYIQEVREREWADMALGKTSAKAGQELQYLSQAIFEGRPEQLKDVAIYHHALDLLTTINDSRNERLDNSRGSVPTVLWLVMLAGGLVTLGYPSFFGSSNLTAQVLMTAALAALVALTLFVAVVLDYPFTGDVRISSTPFEEALDQMPPQWPPP